MARFLLVIIIWIVCVGSVTLYMNRRNAAARVGPAQTRIEHAEGKFAIEITPTFTAVPDPFALQTEDSSAEALVVRLGKQDLLRVSDRIEGGEPIRIDNVKGLAAGANEIFVQASPPVDQSDRAHAVRVRVLRDGAAVGEQTFWSEGGSTVSGSYLFHLKHSEEADHEH